MKKLLNCLCLIFLILANFSFSSICRGDLQEHKVYRVARVIDGDTIKLENGEHVRLIGIDAPELKDNAKLQRDLKERHLTKSAEIAMGRRSYQFTKHLIEGKKVHLEFDKDKYDEYHRVLAYVYLTSGIFVNAQIVSEGYAYAYTVKPDLQYAQLFRKLYKEAREEHRGLWQEEKSRRKHFKWFNNT